MEVISAIGTSLTFFFFLFFRGCRPRARFTKGKLEWGSFQPLEMSLMFLLFFFFRDAFLDLDFGLGYECKLGVVFFSFFFVLELH